MATFFEQFRDFLAPRFQLERELGSGGMGTVYLARDTQLPRCVAVKVLPHAKAGAAAIARFLREARILARLDHANIVKIIDVGRDSDPFIYYIMDYFDGGTLADRLTKGPLSPEEAAEFGRHILDALRHAHARGVIHRDIKPSNIFWGTGRGWVLADFGIAKSSAEVGEPYTEPGQVPGTPGYIPPERQDHRDVPQGDLYSVGLVLYQALTGQPWEVETEPEQVDWTGVPARMRPALRRALALTPEERWPDAAAFQQALWMRRVRIPSAGRSLSVAGAVVALVVLARILRPCWLGKCPDADVRIDHIKVAGAAVFPGLGDSIASRVSDRLKGFPDFSVIGPGVPGRAKSTVNGSAAADSGGALRIQLLMPGQQLLSLATRVEQWRAAADMLADSLLVRFYGSNPLDSDLPVAVLPRDPDGLRSFLKAEKAFARSAWYSAWTGYDEAATVDRTCALCFWRHAEVARFFVLPPDTADAAEYRARVNEFPPNYQTLIRAELVPLDARLDSLYALTRRAPAFLFGRFRWGDELLHRGPLVGQPRLRASMGFTRATEMRRDFVPAWEHLAWLRIAEGNQRAATAALDTLDVLPRPGSEEIGMRDLLRVAYAWRFLPAAQAESQTRAALDAPTGHAIEHLDAGARYLTHFGAPVGAVWLGGQLEARGYRRSSAMIAQVFGDLAAGRPEQALRVLGRGVTESGDPDLEMLQGEIAAMLLMFDRDSVAAAAAWRSVDSQLGEISQRLPASLRPRAAWMRAILARRFGGGPRTVPPGIPAPLARLLEAYDAAARDRLPEAIARSQSLLGLPADSIGDPCLRTVLHLLRAEWRVRAGTPQLADQELLWYENSDAVGFPEGDAQAMEVDWSFGTLARWWRLRLATSEEQRCGLAREVARLWTGAEPPYASRADKAREIARSCPEPAS